MEVAVVWAARRLCMSDVQQQSRFVGITRHPGGTLFNCQGRQFGKIDLHRWLTTGTATTASERVSSGTGGVAAVVVVVVVVVVVRSVQRVVSVCQNDVDDVGTNS